MQNYLFTSDIFKGSRYEKGHPLDMDRVGLVLNLFN